MLACSKSRGILSNLNALCTFMVSQSRVSVFLNISRRNFNNNGCRRTQYKCESYQKAWASGVRVFSVRRSTRHCSNTSEPVKGETANSKKLQEQANMIENVIKENKYKIDTSIPNISPEESLKPYYYKPTAVDIDYNVRYTRNTFISTSRAISDYLLSLTYTYFTCTYQGITVLGGSGRFEILCDLDGLRKTRMRNAYSSDIPPDYCYLKTDVEERAMEVWGSMEALERERKRRKEEMEEGERYRKGLSALLGHLKKTIKEQTKQQEDNQLFGGEKQRKLLVEGSARVVIYAVAANLFVMLLKFSAYLYTGSASMMSESIHSFADAANQCLLALGILKSIKEPSPDHPYGWSRARYAYSLISGVGIFFLGCGFSVYHGISEILNPTQLTSLPVAFAVLGGSMVVESLTMITAFKQVQKSARESGLSFKEYLVRGRDPNAVAVLLEDSAAVTGLLLAAGCLGLTSYTGNIIFDAIGSISIGALLGVVAVFLIRRNTDALTGRSIHPDRLRQIIELLENDIMVRSIHDVKATEMGADTVRFKAEINFDGREVTKVHVNRLNMEELLMETQAIKTTEQLENFLLDHGEQIIDVLGSQVDRIERNIKKKSPEVRHVDLEIL